MLYYTIERLNSMLLRFSVENFRSFKERQTLFLSAVKTCKEWRDENTAEDAGQRILRSAVIYGANASGKTNLFLAMERMRIFMLVSVDIDKNPNKLFAEPFLLSMESVTKPETFELQFTYGGKVFTYGFSLLLTGKGIDQYEVSGEWLIENVKKKDVPYFLRERRIDADGRVANVISVDKKKMPQGVGLEGRTRPDSLFFTVAAQFAEPVCQSLMEYIRSSLNVVSGLNHQGMNIYSRNQLVTNPVAGLSMKKLIHDADTGIKDVAIAPDGQLISVHNRYNESAKAIGDFVFNFHVAESQGTLKIFDLSGVLIDTLNNGRVLVVDELDAKLHPVLVRRLVMLFNNPETNPKNAQLIVNVQSPDLLAFKVFYEPRKRAIARLRRDQLYFVEKNNTESSCLTSLIEFKNENGGSTRNDSSFAKDYMLGHYGGIPYVRELVKPEV